MAIEKEIIQSEIRATGAKQVQDDMIRINQAMKELIQEEKNLSFIKNRLESDGKKNTQEYKNNTAAIKLNKEAITKNREELTKLSAQMKISDMTYNQLSKRAAELRNHLNNISRSADPAKWDLYNARLRETTDQMSRVRGGTQAVSSTTGALTKAMGFLGIGLSSIWASFRFGKSVMESTDATGDQLEETVGGMTSAWEYFKKSLASGDWSNFFANISKAITAGREFAQVMDEIGDRQRSVTMLNADELKHSKELELIWRDRTKSAKDRKDALIEWQGLQENAAIREQDIAQKNYNALVDRTSAENDITKGALEENLKNYVLYEKEIKKMQDTGVYSTFKSNKATMGEDAALNSNLLFNGTGYVQLNEVQKKILVLTKDIGNVTGQERDKIVAAYKEMRNAEAAVLDGKLQSLRAEGQIEGVLNKSTDANNKSSKSAVKRNEDVLTSRQSLSAKLKPIIQSDAEFEEEMLQHLGITRAQANQAKLDAEKSFQEKRIAFIEEYSVLSSNELKDLELNQLNDRYNELLDREGLNNEERLEITESFEEAKAEIEDRYRTEKLEKIAQELAATNAMFQTANEFIATLQDAAISNLEADYDHKIQLAGKNKNEITRLEEEKERKIKETKKRYADKAFAIQVAQIIASTAQAAINAFTSLSSIPIVGPALGAIAAAAATALGIAQISKASAERNKVKSLWTGGYTGEGDKFTPRGVVHADEYVVSSDEYAQPEVRSFVDSVVEPMRMKRLGYSSYAQSTTTPGYANGGYTGSRSETKGLQATLERQNQALETNNALMNHLITEGVNANFDESKIKEMRDRVARQEAMDARAKR
jgi:hypothetical protein